MRPYQCEMYVNPHFLQRTHCSITKVSFNTITLFSMECNQCDFYSQKHDDPQFQCDTCSMKFYKAEVLRRHQLTHTNERRMSLDLNSLFLSYLYVLFAFVSGYKCSYCENSYIHSDLGTCVNMLNHSYINAIVVYHFG